MNARTWLLGVTTLLLVAAGSVYAHHSFAAQFDVNKVETVVGTIARMEWKSPHAWLFVDVKNGDGQLQSWTVEFSSANSLYQRGWRKEDLPVGATVTVTGYRATNAALVLSARAVKLPDGTTLFEGAAAAAN